MKIYSFEWVEMSGGFEQQVNIMASSKENAIKIFMIVFWWRGQLKILDSIEEFNKFSVSVTCLQEVYTLEHINKLNRKIHYTENEQYTFLF